MASRIKIRFKISASSHHCTGSDVCHVIMLINSLVFEDLSLDLSDLLFATGFSFYIMQK